MSKKTPRKREPQRLLIWIVVLVIVCGLCGVAAIVGLKMIFGDEEIRLDRISRAEPDQEQAATVARIETETPSATAPQAPTVLPEPPVSEASAEQDLIERARQYEGDWEGGWTNNTFGSSGEAVGSITVDDTGEFTFVIDLGGSVFGMGDPPPMTYVGQVSEEGAFLEAMGDPLFGDLAMVVTPDGQVTIVGDLIPVEGIASLMATGTITPTQATLAYTVIFSFGDPAQGEVMLEKVP